MEANSVTVRHLTLQDMTELRKASESVYLNKELATWNEPTVKALLTKFPDGQICVVVDGIVVGCAFSLIIEYADFGDEHTYSEITSNMTFDNHDPKGDSLYGIEVFIHPDYRGLRLARRLYDARKELCENLNLRAIVAGGRMPNYAQHSDKMSAKQYIEKVKIKELYDPVLSFQLANDFYVRKLLTGYLSGDSESMEYATLLEWPNIFYTKSVKLINAPRSEVRLGLVQWQMRSMKSIDDLFEQMEFYVDAVSDYKSDFVLFPELFNAPLMAEFNHLRLTESIRRLSEYTEQIRDKFIEFAISYNINIITGSMPFFVDGSLYNSGFLCRRDGSWERYDKIHLTPAEVRSWSMVGGKNLKVFDTDCGKIGIMICYDVEFPEYSRILADQGMNILFVPFLTDTQNGYTRVRHCAMARAIENECYVAIAGAVGNLPKVNNMDIQYAQSAVFTPSDFAFPTTGIKAEATPNSEMTVIVDVNLDLLKQLHSHGAVHTMRDRRHDLYSITQHKKD
ncbi:MULTISPECIES: carbon-nitrogen hydrolase family protein [unclassified Colwellia]|jgi:predicted amidohydrolase/GNAT superfamily N-acetyltransferase|uniref:carbon-nitrogen hydrolase family protein n=1 Tax=unclassified Colwellia TaxID=196834 RepID=UPI0015F63DE1|nr:MULTISPECIES: bifunctional GNAT family N-acetyltransferase/carbon-nitrogen hydrolase family protein [unclassified Colwellia]MBA6253902.1 bifunctional GNAT family N-acetyltransferase/carbon-nitrogen hydrolase family protein [Colwellia sp. MB3u-55]MBA6396387.1 bifunctional GNAT family N-acetyltransferase/carbon-nitrogen hydrolase family protein [Colwellia sp. BRX10-4]